MRSERPEPVAGIVLAAGRSSRMGRNKLLLELSGQPVVRRATQRALDAGLAPVLVVVGFEADRVREAVAGLPVETILNTGYERGINGSVRAGIAEVPTTARAAVVLLADMPLVTAEMIRAAVDRYRETGAPLVISEYGGVRAPPTLYDRSLFAEFVDQEGEGCGRRIVRRHRERAVVLEWPPSALTDLDRMEDVERVRAQESGAVT